MNKVSMDSIAPEILEPAPTATPFRPPSFEVDDEEGYKYLEEHGYVVFTNVLNQEEVEKGKNLAWEFLEKLPNASIKRDDHNSWSEGWPDTHGKGIIVVEGAGQSEFLWYVRGVEKVKQIYSKIWGTDDLITSFDGFCMHRPFEYNPNWLTRGGWYHVDQNGHKKPGKICVQGLVNFYDAGEEDGGLVVVPDTTKIFNEICDNRPQFKDYSDFLPLATNDEKGIWKNEAKDCTPVKICAKPGDMILWDSRTVHCNAPATSARTLPTDGTVLSPRRVVCYVCMTPKSRASSEVIAYRRQCYVDGHTTSHWPEECRTDGRRNILSDYKPVELTDAQKALIPL
eukprot:TRINITY_DN1806_c0_g3_i1.p1 TRINITY_DN1806_c0_g3~~TRINITY_DN1806_c0_g3_i1.p1  ORF type:complete len:340 (-),score=75.15 TRINITY_DN1806_c0_g3_i1:56-1075(-)